MRRLVSTIALLVIIGVIPGLSSRVHAELPAELSKIIDQLEQARQFSGINGGIVDPDKEKEALTAALHDLQEPSVVQLTYWKPYQDRLNFATNAIQEALAGLVKSEVRNSVDEKIRTALAEVQEANVTWEDKTSTLLPTLPYELAEPFRTIRQAQIYVNNSLLAKGERSIKWALSCLRKPAAPKLSTAPDYATHLQAVIDALATADREIDKESPAPTVAACLASAMSELQTSIALYQKQPAPPETENVTAPGPAAPSTPATINLDNGATLKFTFVADSSAKLEPKGYRKNPFPAMTIEDPTAVVRGGPVYFDMHTGHAVHFTVDSAKPLTKLVYTGVAFNKFFIKIQDSTGNEVTSAGPFDYGNKENTVEVPLPGLTRFDVIVHDQSRDWILIESIRFEAGGAASTPNAPSALGAPAATASPFSGTTWTSSVGGAISTIVFAADGKWTEDWKSVHLEGHWQATPDNTAAVVTRTDNIVYHYRLNDQKDLVRDERSMVYHLATSFAAPSIFGTSAAPSATALPTAALTEDQARAVVLVTGDNAEGTGFLIKTPDGPAVVTNIHVIANNPNLKITTNTGALIKVLSMKGASDRDLAMLAIEQGPYSYLQMAPDISQVVEPGDEVITPGNSEGGEVMLNTTGKILGIGPKRIEFNNPIYHGNSGGPVFHTKSGKVLGVVTEAMTVTTSDALDKASFASRNSAISGSMRYFGLRLDTVTAWVPIDARRFAIETSFLDAFDQRSRALDSYLNAPNDDNPEDNFWRKDDKIVKANDEFFAQATGADTSQRMNADRIMWSEFNDIAATDMDAIQNPANFYSFDQQRAKDEAAYRKALIAELTGINNNVSRLGSLPRSNH